MKLLRATGLLVLSAGLFAGCESEGATGVTFADLVGSWEASGFTYTSTANSSTSVDVISQLGGSLTVAIASDESFTGNVHIPSVTPDGGVPIAGTLTLDAEAETLEVDFNTATEDMGLFSDFIADFELSENGNALTWTYGGTSFDFNQDGTPEPAVVTVELNR